MKTNQEILNQFKIGQTVTPVSEKNHAYGESLVISKIWPIGKGGVNGRIIAGGFSFLPTQLR